VELLKKIKVKKTHLHGNMISEKYFPAVMKVYRNYFIAIVIADR